MLDIKAAYDAVPVYSDEELETLTDDELGVYLELLQSKKQFEETHQLLYFKPDPWLNKLNKKMINESVCSILASNRSGKSYSTTWALACHLTGIYPEDWEGFKYDVPIAAWMMTPTGENYVQDGGICEYLFGKPDARGTGWVPQECIDRVEMGMGAKGLIKKAYIKHVTGGISTVEYKSYEQGANMLQGASIDLLVIDEEPKNPKIFPEAITRILQAPSGYGRALLCFTPTNGFTELVEACMEGKYKVGCERITVWDCPWITPEKIDEMMKAIPEREWDLRLKGIPSIGRGAVFPQHETEIKFYSSDVEIKDHWLVASAIDFGYLPDPCAVLFGALDQDNGCYYIFKEYYETEKTVAEIAGWIKRFAPSIPVIYPADGNRKQQAAAGQTFVEMFQGEGIYMAERVDYGKAGERETGHSHLRTLFRQGQLYVGDNCPNWFKEFRVYQYDEKGKTDHCEDHAMDCLRYLMQKLDKVGRPWAECKSVAKPRQFRMGAKSSFKNTY